MRYLLTESDVDVDHVNNLRGDSMTDVIFNGTTERKPVGQASVELIFDNSDGAIQGEYASFNEISIKRQVSRDGQSNYFLNGGKHCRFVRVSNGKWNVLK